MALIERSTGYHGLLFPRLLRGVSARAVDVAYGLSFGGSGGKIVGSRHGRLTAPARCKQKGDYERALHFGGAAGGVDGVGASAALGAGVIGARLPASLAAGIGVAPGASGASPVSSSSGGLPS